MNMQYFYIIVTARFANFKSFQRCCSIINIMILSIIYTFSIYIRTRAAASFSMFGRQNLGPANYTWSGAALCNSIARESTIYR
jgi:hypothetical protein